VAARLAEMLGEQRVVSINTDAMLPDTSTESRVVWVFPVHAWSVPPVVANYIVSLPAESFPAKAVHYMVATCGDDVGQTDLVWRALMQSKGWQAAGAYSVEMPNTYVLLPGFDVDSPEVEQRKLADAPRRIRLIAERIAAGSSDTDVVAGAMPVMKTRVLGPLFRRFLMSPRPFRANSVRCTGCGRCARQCPAHNITMCDNTPVWSDHCTMCLACYHGCPVNAVEYGRMTRRKGHYRGPA
jgi:ferredoxin